MYRHRLVPMRVNQPLLHYTDHCWGCMILQDVLAAPSAPGRAARLAAAQVAALQQRLEAPPPSLQLLGIGDTLAQQAMLAPVCRRGRRPAAVRSLAAMLRVASVEAPAVRFSAIEFTALAPASDASLVAAAVPAAADAQGQSLSAGTWLGPRLIERQQEAAGSTPGLGSETSFTSPAGRIIVTGGSSFNRRSWALPWIPAVVWSHLWQCMKTDCTATFLCLVTCMARLTNFMHHHGRRHGRGGVAGGAVAGGPRGEAHRAAGPLGALPRRLAPGCLQVCWPENRGG